MTRKKVNKTYTIDDIIFVKNLLTVLTKNPYREYFNKYLKDKFIDILGKSSVDNHLHFNKKFIATDSFETVANNIVKFALQFYPDIASNIVNSFYSHSHLFNKTYDRLDSINASKLLDQEYLNDSNSKSQKIKSFIGSYMYKRSGIHIVTAPPSGGKTLMLLQEAVFQAIVGHKVMYFVVGDMDEYSIGHRLSNIVEYYESKFNGTKDSIDKIDFYIYPAQSISIYDITNEIKRLEESGIFHDFVFIDYDDNLANYQDNDNMYIAASIPYQVIDEYKDGKVIVFASQLKVSAAQSKSVSSIGKLAGSSRKEYIADQIYAIEPLDLRDNNNFKKRKEQEQQQKTKFSTHKLLCFKDRHNFHEGSPFITELVLDKGVFKNINEV